MSRLSLPAQIESVEKANALVDGLPGFLNSDKGARASVYVVIDEIVSNIAYYAYDSGGSFEIEAVLSNDILTLIFADSGREYNPLTQAEPDVDAPISERKIGGLGIYFVRKLTDRVEYARENGKNILTITKTLRR